jgi:hypothetical protein
MVAGRSIGLGALCSFGSYGVVFCFYMVVWSPFSLFVWCRWGACRVCLGSGMRWVSGTHFVSFLEGMSDVVNSAGQ